jgi:chitinase
MFPRIIKLFLLLVILSPIIIIAQKKEIVAYYPEWGATHKTYYVKDLKTSGSADKITVLIYAFAVPAPDSTGNIIVKFIDPYTDYEQTYSSAMSIDGVADDSTQRLRGQLNQLKKLKKEYPDLKILISIGGWGGGTYFSDAVLNSCSRKYFVDDCINKFILGNLPVDSSAGGQGTAQGIFDGIDIDWEFPIKGGPEGTHNNVSDKEHLTRLLSLFRKELNKINPKLILTMAVSADKPNVNNYDIKKDQQYLNWFNLMTYDFHGSWDKVTAHHTNLLSSPEDTTDNGIKCSFDKSVKYFLDSLEVSNQKIIPGAAFYGKCWFNVDSVNGGLYQPGSDSTGVFTEAFGNYSNLCTLESKGYNYYWDSLAMAPWLYNPQKKIFWTYDDPKSIALKSRYVDSYNLRGLMFWEISGDDSAGTLVNTIYTRNMPIIKRNNFDDKRIWSIKITSPIKGQTVKASSNLIINTSTTNSNYDITKVEFFVDDKSIGYDTKAPFDWVWFNTQKGSHKIKVIATDISGNKKSSKEVTVNIY